MFPVPIFEDNSDAKVIAEKRETRCTKHIDVVAHTAREAVRDWCLAGCMAMHACQIDPTDTAPPAWDCHNGPASRQGEHFEAGNLSALISPLLLKYADGATTLSLCLGSQGLRLTWWIGCRVLPKLTGLDCLLLLPLLSCWWQKWGGWDPALGAGWRRLWATPATPALSPSCGALSEW